MNWLQRKIADAVGYEPKPLATPVSVKDYPQMEKPSIVEQKLARLLMLSTNPDGLIEASDMPRDDYDPCIRHGDSFSIVGGDFVYRFSFQNYDPSSVTVLFDGIMVMSFSVRNRMVHNLKSDKLTQAIIKSIDQIITNLNQRQAMIKLRDQMWEDEKKHKTQRVARRWGAEIVDQ